MTPEQTIGTVLATVDKLRRGGISTRRMTPQLAGSVAVKVLRDEGYTVLALDRDVDAALAEVVRCARAVLADVKHAQGGYWVTEDRMLRLRRAVLDLEDEE